MKNQLLADIHESGVGGVSSPEEKSMWEIFVPTHSNIGEKYSVEFHNKWDSFITSGTVS